jgi:hypothetical protein
MIADPHCPNAMGVGWAEAPSRYANQMTWRFVPRRQPFVESVEVARESGKSERKLRAAAEVKRRRMAQRASRAPDGSRPNGRNDGAALLCAVLKRTQFRPPQCGRPLAETPKALERDEAGALRRPAKRLSELIEETLGREKKKGQVFLASFAAGSALLDHAYRGAHSYHLGAGPDETADPILIRLLLGDGFRRIKRISPPETGPCWRSGMDSNFPVPRMEGPEFVPV